MPHILKMLDFYEKLKLTVIFVLESAQVELKSLGIQRSLIDSLGSIEVWKDWNILGFSEGPLQLIIEGTK